MDNSGDPSTTGSFDANSFDANSFDAQWAPSRVGGALLGLGGLLLLIAAVTASDAAGAVLMGVAGALLIAASAHALLVRPRLAVRRAPQPELTIRTIGGRRTYRREQIERIRVISMRRVGRRTGQLELDLLPDGAAAAPDPTSGLREDTRLVVFGRWDLGADLSSVVDALRRAGFTVDDNR